MDFIKKLRQVQNKFLELVITCKIGDLHFIYKFFNSISFSFDIFFIIFNQM